MNGHLKKHDFVPKNHRQNQIIIDKKDIFYQKSKSNKKAHMIHILGTFSKHKVKNQTQHKCIFQH